MALRSKPVMFSQYTQPPFLHYSDTRFLQENAVEIILIAVPFFFILIAIEVWQDRRKGTGYYRLNDAISSLNLGVVSRLTGIFKFVIPFSAYVWIYEHYAVWQLSQESMWIWLLAFVIYDLGYYWVHRLSHRMHIMWGSHVVHHSSEEYNLTTALRQTGTPAVFAWLIFLPMAVLGISPTIVLTCAALNLIYQFWVHTRHIDKLPAWFEAIFVTPSHHRVHHALNREYIDKNYAGVFILWDKWFGSFAAEKPDVEIVYGVSQQLNSFNPVWANWQVYRGMLQDVWRTQRFSDKLKTLLMPPGWRAGDMQQQFPRQYVSTTTLKKYNPPLTAGLRRYLLVQFAILVGLVFLLLLNIPTMPLSLSIGLSLLAIGHCWLISVLQEGKPFSVWLEPLRLISIAVSLILLLPLSDALYYFAVLLITVFSILWFVRVRLTPQDAADTHPVSLQNDA